LVETFFAELMVAWQRNWIFEGLCANCTISFVHLKVVLIDMVVVCDFTTVVGVRREGVTRSAL